MRTSFLLFNSVAIRSRAFRALELNSEPPGVNTTFTEFLLATAWGSAACCISWGFDTTGAVCFNVTSFGVGVSFETFFDGGGAGKIVGGVGISPVFTFCCFRAKSEILGVIGFGLFLVSGLILVAVFAVDGLFFVVCFELGTFRFIAANLRFDMAVRLL